jgi:uncharacterized protein YvpB
MFHQIKTGFHMTTPLHHDSISSRTRTAHRSPGSGLPVSRRRLLGGAALAAATIALGGPFAPHSAAQDRDPFQYITAMEATVDVGQLPGQAADEIAPVVHDGTNWDAYIQLPIKEGQDFHYTCEFDSAWIVLQAYGHDMSLEEQMAHVGHDLSIEPYWEETPSAITVYGGDIAEMFSGDYVDNILARARTSAVRKAFDAVDLTVTEAPDRESTEQALLRGEPVFFKSTVDFLDWRQATWICPDGDEYPVVLTNDHALIVMGFDSQDVIIRDPLGPTTTNEIRPWQYRVSWERYLQVIAAQGNDAVAVGPPTVQSDGTEGAG